MIIVDRALEERHQQGSPIRIAMAGAGFMGRGIALQMLTSARGMNLVAISNRHLEGARRAYSEAGVDQVRVVDSVGQLESAIHRGEHSITDDAMLLCQADGIDVVVEVT